MHAGTGKTSLIKALASHTGRNIVSIPLLRIQTNQVSGCSYTATVRSNRVCAVLSNRMRACIGSLCHASSSHSCSAHVIAVIMEHKYCNVTVNHTAAAAATTVAADSVLIAA
jgi:hypothetical protein